jgi:tetratricopeptide (TPR) repeat protein
MTDETIKTDVIDESGNIIIKNENDAWEIYKIGLGYWVQNDFDNMIKYYKAASDFGQLGATLELGKYYYKMQMYDNMFLYYNKAVAMGESFAMIAIARYYKEHHKYDDMTKYYMMAFDTGDVSAIKELAFHYFAREDNDNMCKCYTMVIERHKDVESMYDLSVHYAADKTRDDMLNYSQMVLDNTVDCVHDENYKYRKSTLQRMARYYRKCKKYDEMLKYYNILVKNGETATLIDIAEHYKMVGNVELTIEYYVKAAHYKYIRAIIDLSDYYIDNKLIQDGLKMFIKLQHTIEHNAATTETIQLYISKFLEDPTIFTNFFNDYNKLLDSLKKKDDYIEELEVMPEGPKYAEAKKRFNKAAGILSEIDDDKMSGGLDED